jgi:phosphatidylserine/phosphatidylglycerophosphate/cardiolipin synthase-like enzyme
VWCCLDIRRPLNDTSLADGLVRRFAQDFVTRHWPWEPKPEVYYDPRSLETPGAHRSSLHAKCVVVDHRAALITSANFTEAAQERNIECGVIMRHSPIVEQLHRYFKTLCESRQLRRCELPV